MSEPRPSRRNFLKASAGAVAATAGAGAVAMAGAAPRPPRPEGLRPSPVLVHSPPPPTRLPAAASPTDFIVYAHEYRRLPR